MSWNYEDDDIPGDRADDDDWREPWKDPFHDYEPPDPEWGCSWCEDTGCTWCTPSRWERIRWAIRGRLDRLLRRRVPKVDDPWGRSDDESPF